MRKVQIAAAVVVAGACSMPVMAQSGGSSTQSSPSTSAGQSGTSSSDTRSMGAGAGPSTDTGRPARDDDLDLGWLGLLGLTGLLGLRRRHQDDHVRHPNAAR
jgi:hypothetical protein